MYAVFGYEGNEHQWNCVTFSRTWLYYDKDSNAW